MRVACCSSKRRLSPSGRRSWPGMLCPYYNRQWKARSLLQMDAIELGVVFSSCASDRLIIPEDFPRKKWPKLVHCIMIQR